MALLVCFGLFWRRGLICFVVALLGCCGLTCVGVVALLGCLGLVCALALFGCQGLTCAGVVALLVGCGLNCVLWPYLRGGGLGPPDQVYLWP